MSTRETRTASLSASDQLLDVMIAFSVAYQPALGEEGVAQYFWRLNSAK